ncbi:MAG TPA: MFS transporter [Anaerolineales bacterium]|nr:MFS transporter [Anaerolineales bacterium]
MRSPRYRWFVVFVFFAFILLHQSDRLLISPLTTSIMEEFSITKTQMGAVVSGALLVGAVLFPLWGYLYDRFARAKLLALASFIWGATTWLSAIAPTYPAFLATRASTGIDDSSYPGLYSLISDYFGPAIRGKVYGLLQLAQPIGYLAAMGLALVLGEAIGWRKVFYLTGSLGLVVAVLILLLVRDVPRGRSEPELADLDKIGVYRFDPKVALGLFRKRTLLFLFAQGFVGVFPWNVITFWFFAYLETERSYDSNSILLTMAPAVLVLAAGYFVGGGLGDWAFRRTPRGRLLVSMAGVLLGAVFLSLTLSVPVANPSLFFVLLLITALFIPFASPNVISTVYDISPPEVRSTALAIQYFIEDGGAALAPLLAGIVADRSSLGVAILAICVSAWILGSILLGFAAHRAPKDIQALRTQMRDRAEQERARQANQSATG